MIDEYTELKQDIKEAKIKSLLGNHDPALQTYEKIIVEYKDKVLEDSEKHSFRSFVVEAMYLKCHVFIAKLELATAKKQALELEKFSEKANYQAGTARACQALAYIAAFANDYKKAMEYARKSLEISQALVKSFEPQKFPLMLLTTAYHVLGMILYSTGDVDASIDYNLKSIEISEKQGNYLELARSYNNLANCYSEKGDHEKAIEIYKKAKVIDEKLNDLRGKGIALMNMALEYQYTGDYEKALEHNQESIDLLKEAGLENAVSENLRTFGRLYMDIGEYRLAEEYFEKALALADSLRILKDKAQILGDQARLLFLKGSFKQAKKKFKESLVIYENSGVEEELVGKLCFYSELLITTDKLDEAEEILTRATEIATKHGNRREELDCLFNEALLEKKRENYGIAKNLLQDMLERAKSLNYNLMHINTCLVFAEFAIEKFEKNQTKKSFSKAMNYIEEAEELSQKSKIFPKLIETMIIKASLYSADLELDKALKLLEKAKDISHDKKLKKYTQRVETMIDQVLDRKIIMEQVSNKAALSRVAKMAAEDVLSLMVFRVKKDLEIMNEFNLDKFYLSVFKYGRRGPRVVATDELPFHDPEDVLLSIGVFYSLAIGQGNRHHEGLFGPLPLADYYDFASLIYAATIKDEMQIDERMKGKSYCLFCLFYPTKFSQLFYERSVIAKVFESKIGSLEDVKEMTEIFLTGLKESIYGSITQG
ncbi:MAG: tetratricopeptide repeat protein [Candidatus Odinarchaeota archaeon]